jgi:outer membrane protein assembly factor BamB
MQMTHLRSGSIIVTLVSLAACGGRLLEEETLAPQGAELVPPKEGDAAAPPDDASHHTHRDVDAAPMTRNCDNAGVQSGSPWPTHGGCPHHRAASPFVGPGSAHVLWTWDGGGDAPPVIDAAGTIYITTVDSRLAALSSAGKLLWSRPVQASQTSALVGADGTIYYAGNDRLSAFWPDGTTRFESNSGADWGDFFASPAVGHDGTVYFTNEAHALVAMSSAGTRVWSAGDDSITHSSPAVGADGTIYFSTSMHALVAVDTGGTVLWQSPDHRDGAGPPMLGPVIAADGTVYIASRGGLDAYQRDGRRAWHFDAGGGLSASPSVGTGGTLYIGGGIGGGNDSPLEDHHFYAVRSNGSVAWRADTDGIFSAQAVVGADGTVYAASWGGTLYAWHPDGTLAWSFSTGHRAIGFSAPVLGADGTLYLCADNKLYAFGP